MFNLTGGFFGSSAFFDDVDCIGVIVWRVGSLEVCVYRSRLIIWFFFEVFFEECAEFWVLGLIFSVFRCRCRRVIRELL